VVNVGVPGARPGHELFIPSLPPAGLKVGADIPDQDGMIIVISWRTRSLTADSFSNQCLERIWAKLFDLCQSLSASEPA
jgi:hypothetical protein